MPRDPPVTRTEAPSKRHSAFGSGSYAGADDGIVSQPMRAQRLTLAALGERRRVPEAVEELHLLLAVLAHGVIVGEVLDELPHAGAELVREVRRRRPDEGVDVVARRLDHSRQPNGRVGPNPLGTAPG